MKHTITPARPPASATRRPHQATIPARRPVPPLRSPVQREWPFLLLWMLRQQVAHPRMALSAILLVWGLAACVVCSHLMPHAATSGSPHQTGATPTPQPVSSVASRVQALYQGDPSIGWDSAAQYHAWWHSACAPAALTEVLRAWGAHARIGQVLDQLIAARVISIPRGLLDANGLSAVARLYDDQAETFWGWNVSQVAQITRQGVPVLVDIVDARRQTPYPAFDVGHWLVVVNVSASQVAVRDSSGYRIHALSLALFHTLFTGVVTVVWQGALSLPREG